MGRAYISVPICLADGHSADPGARACLGTSGLAAGRQKEKGEGGDKRKEKPVTGSYGGLGLHLYAWMITETGRCNVHSAHPTSSRLVYVLVFHVFIKSRQQQTQHTLGLQEESHYGGF